VSNGACGFSDANGWDEPQYYLTILAADIDGDGRAEVMGRFVPGVVTEKFNAEMAIWQPPVPLVAVDSRLMENYVVASPISSASITPDGALRGAQTNSEVEIPQPVDYHLHGCRETFRRR
jgi:hypothetical protein